MRYIKKIMALVLSLVLVVGMTLTIPGVTRAASFSITSGLSTDLSKQEFYINNPGNEALYYDVQKEKDIVQTAISISSSTTLQLEDINAYYVVYLYNEIREEVSAVSPSQHGITVNYNVGGQVIEAYSDQIYQGDSFAYEADEYYMLDNKEYRIKSGEGASQVLYYGKSNYVFNYELYEPEAVNGTVSYVDTSGNVIGGESKSISYYGGTVSFVLPATLTVDGREYEKVSPTNTVSLNYFSPQLAYDIEYRLKGAPQAGPYSVEVIFQGEDGMALGNRYYTVDPADDLVNLPEQPSALSARNGGVITYYEAVDSTMITHDAKGETRQYIIKYRVFDQKAPYQWTVRLLDAASGKLLKEERKEVLAEGSASFDVVSVIQSEGKNFILDAAMQKNYTHQYGDERILNVYYNEEGVDIAASYALNIRYKSVSTNEVLLETSKEVTPDAGAVIEAPGEYEANSKNYVRLAGQEDQVTHNFYSPQRSYTIYYRDINDLQNVDTVVTREDIIFSENLIIQDDPAEQTPATTPAEETPAQVTVLTNETTGEIVTLTDEGVPLAGGTPENPQLVTSEDEEVPLAEGLGNKSEALGATSESPIARGLLIFMLVLATGMVAFIIYRKKKKNIES